MQLAVGSLQFLLIRVVKVIIRFPGVSFPFGRSRVLARDEGLGRNTVLRAIGVVHTASLIAGLTRNPLCCLGLFPKQPLALGEQLLLILEQLLARVRVVLVEVLHQLLDVLIRPMLRHQFGKYAVHLSLGEQLRGTTEENLHRRMPATLVQEVAFLQVLLLHHPFGDKAGSFIGRRGLPFCGGSSALIVPLSIILTGSLIADLIRDLSCLGCPLSVSFPLGRLRVAARNEDLGFLPRAVVLVRLLGSRRHLLFPSSLAFLQPFVFLNGFLVGQPFGEEGIVQ